LSVTWARDLSFIYKFAQITYVAQLRRSVSNMRLRSQFAQTTYVVLACQSDGMWAGDSVSCGLIEEAK
jgi:hypothetical protein